MAQGVGTPALGTPLDFGMYGLVEYSETRERLSRLFSHPEFRFAHPAYERSLVRGRSLHSRQPVLAVNILAELHDAVAARPGGNVDPVQRHGLRHLGVLALAGFDDAVDLLERPAARFLQHPGDKLAHILHPHAARRMEAEILAEQILQRRVVHIHAVGAGKIDADRAERVEAAGILLERIV